MPSYLVTMVFAAAFGEGVTCGRSVQDGCDLYRGVLDLEAGTLSSLALISGEAGTAEWFPAVDPTGRFVAFERGSGRKGGTISVVPMAGGDVQTVEQGRYPDFSPVDRKLVWSSPDRRLRVGEHDTDLLMGRVQTVGSGRDPQFSPGGTALIAHWQPRGETTRTVVVDLGNGSVSDFSPADRCAHAAWSPDGDSAVCGVMGRVVGRHWEDGAWGEMVDMVSAPAPAALDARFSGCDGVSMAYPEYCGDGGNLLITLGCMRRGQLLFSNLFLYRQSDATWMDLHAQAVGQAGANTGQSATGACHAEFP